MLRNLGICLTLAAALAYPLRAQDSPSHDRNIDVRSPAGDLHVGKDADAKRVGLPLYPGARLKDDDPNSSQANLSLLTDAFGMKLVVANYVSDDAPAKIIDFYRNKLKRYGKVIECHSQKSGVDVRSDDKDSGKDDDKQLKCDQDSGPVTELKVGTEDNQHVVSVEPGDGKGTHFALVFVHTRGKQGDI